MELRHLRYVIAVAEELHFGRAAARLHISQPPLSQQIQKLEEELGIKIFLRTNRQVQLTEGGRRFVEEARKILAHVEHATRIAVETGSGIAGQLVVAAMRLERTVVVEAVKLFVEENPRVAIELMSLDTPEQIEALVERRVDVGFLRMPVRDNRLVAEAVSRTPMVIGMPKNHALAKYRRLSITALADKPMIMFRRTLNPLFYDQIIKVCRDAGFTPKIAFEGTDVFSAFNLVEAGLGLALFPASVLSEKPKGLVFREIHPPVMQAECGVVYRRDDDSIPLEAFLKIVRKVSRASLA
jgi:DNA-binding transcriptional LysR family regulator